MRHLDPDRLPAIIRHPSGRAYIRYTDPLTKKRPTVYIGDWPSTSLVPSQELIVARLEVMKKVWAGLKPTDEFPADKNYRTVAVFFDEYLSWAWNHYRDSKGRKSAQNYRLCFVPVVQRFEKLPVEDLTVAHLRKVQEDLIATGRTRQGINRQMSRIKTVFNQGASIGLCSGRLALDLSYLRSLDRRRSSAPESAEIEPMKRADLDKIVAKLAHPVRDMARVQWMTGCRPGEICQLRWSEIDVSKEIWIWSPKDHKTAHHGHKRQIAILPDAQAILRNYLHRDDLIFTPQEAPRKGPIIDPGESYDTRTYTRAIARAAKAAKCPRASANRIRKGRAQEIMERLGIIAASRFLGHKIARITEDHYLDKCQGKELLGIARELIRPESQDGERQEQRGDHENDPDFYGRSARGL